MQLPIFLYLCHLHLQLLSRLGQGHATDPGQSATVTVLVSCLCKGGFLSLSEAPFHWPGSRLLKPFALISTLLICDKVKSVFVSDS